VADAQFDRGHSAAKLTPLGSSSEQAPDVRIQPYYVSESVGIACGTLLTAPHNAGLATLTRTPNPMFFKRNPETAEEGKAVFACAGAYNRTPGSLSRILIYRGDRSRRKTCLQYRNRCERVHDNRHSSPENIYEKRDYDSTTNSRAFGRRR
jgi:hypothetical protein